MSALSVVLSNAFSKNSKAEFIEKPILQNLKTISKELTEEEKKRQTEQLFMQLMIMGVNHKNNK